jgi:hypothetical protein
MKKLFTITATACLLFALSFSQAWGGALNLPKNTPLVLNLDADISVIADKDAKKIDYQIVGPKNPNDFTLETKSHKAGSLLVLKRAKGAAPFSNRLIIELRLPAEHSFVILRNKNNYSFSNVAGSITANLKSANITLNGCTGAVNLNMKKGNVAVENHRAASAPFFLDIKKGNALVELANAQSAGPGQINVKSGNVVWKMATPCPVDFYGEIQNGLLACNIPLNRKSASVITFISMGGLAKWTVHVGKGSLDVRVPVP